MAEARVAGHAIGQPCLPAALERAFERHARRFGHDVSRLRDGPELVSYPVVPSVAAVRALSAATPGQRRRRQQVFFNPVIELRRSIGQGVHDRLEAAVFADGTIDPADQARTGLENIRTQAGVPVEVYFYPAGHAFFNDENLIGTYDEDAAKTAWNRTLEFLRSALAQHEKTPAG